MTDAINEVGKARSSRGLEPQQALLQMQAHQAQAGAREQAADDALQQMEKLQRNHLQQAAQQLAPATGAGGLPPGHGSITPRSGNAEGRNGLLNPLADLLLTTRDLALQLGRISANNLTQQLNNHLGGSFASASAPQRADPNTQGATAGGGAGHGQQWSAPALQLVHAVEGAARAHLGHGDLHRQPADTLGAAAWLVSMRSKAKTGMRQRLVQLLLWDEEFPMRDDDEDEGGRQDDAGAEHPPRGR